MAAEKIIINDTVLKKQRAHLLHELSAARGSLNLMFDEGVPIESQKKTIEYVKKKLDQIHFSFSAIKVGDKYVPNYLLITYYETMYIVEKADNNISIIKVYEKKRGKHHSEILSYVGESRNSQFDKDLKAFIAKEYFVWQDKSLPYLGKEYEYMMNRLQEKYQ